MKSLFTWILFGVVGFVIYARFFKPKTQAQVEAQDAAARDTIGNISAARTQAAMPPFAMIGKQPLSGASIVATNPNPDQDFIIQLFPTLLGNSRQTILMN